MQFFGYRIFTVDSRCSISLRPGYHLKFSYFKCYNLQQYYNKTDSKKLTSNPKLTHTNCNKLKKKQRSTQKIQQFIFI
jgi:hypothetical protein